MDELPSGSQARRAAWWWQLSQRRLGEVFSQISPSVHKECAASLAGIVWEETWSSFLFSFFGL